MKGSKLGIVVFLAVLGMAPQPSHAQSAAQEEQRHRAVVASVADQAQTLLSSLVAANTVNPPGNEIEAARILAATLGAEGIRSQIFESAPGRASLYARLPAGADAAEAPAERKGAVILLSHLDVVPADVTQWKHAPFAGSVVAGQVHGRGALDCKGVASVETLALIALKRLGAPLDRDVILLATADEEMGGRAGAGWMVEEHFDLFSDAEFVLNEGGFVVRDEPNEGPLLYQLAAAEKGPCWFHVKTKGTPGHGSRPVRPTSVERLIQALNRLVTWDRPLQIVPAVDAYFRAYAEVDEENAEAYRDIAAALKDPEFRREFLENASSAASVSNTLAPNVLLASARTNSVPAEASAQVDSRLLPGTECSAFLDTVRERIADPEVTVEPHAVAFPSSQSPLDSALVRAVYALAAEEESAVVLPALLTGFTDSHYFRAKGMQAYGFIPILVDEAQRDSIHAPNEHVDVEQLKAGVHRLVRLLELIDE